MFAVIAAVLFALALLLELIDESLGEITPGLLTIAGLLCIAIHLIPAWGGRRGWRR
jgi:hypothetical protein